jgi:hypothetical protein
MTQERQEQPSAVIPLPIHKEKVPEEIPLHPQTQNAIAEIQKRDGHTDASPEDVVAMAVEVFNVLTDHLSGKDSKVLLYTQGKGLKTLAIKSSAGSYTEGVKTAHKRVQPPKSKM